MIKEEETEQAQKDSKMDIVHYITDPNVIIHRVGVDWPIKDTFMDNNGIMGMEYTGEQIITIYFHKLEVKPPEPIKLKQTKIAKLIEKRKKINKKIAKIEDGTN